MKRLFALLTILCGCCLLVHAQQIPVNPKFGSVSDAEIDLTSYPADTSAAILLLYGSQDYTIEVDSQGGFRQQIRVHHRWKVLKESGKNDLDYDIYRSTRGDIKETIGDIKVVTYNRENGQVQQQKMSKKYIFDQKYSDYANRVTFAPENVKVGSVVEVSYVFNTSSVQIDRIYFQSDYPVNRMDVRVAYAEYFHYTHLELGNCRIEHKRDNALGTVNLGGGNILDYNLQIDDYTAVDLPALKEEPFSYCPEHFRSSVNYELHSFTIPGVVTRDFNTSWNDVDKTIAQSDLLKCCKAKMKDIEPLQAKLQGIESQVEKIAAVRNDIVSKVKWDKAVRLIPKDGKSLLKDGTGDSADINALVASALNTLGFRAEPVLVKFRTSGPLVQYQISTDQFDAFILRVTCPNGEVHLLDAVRDDAYIDILDPKYQVREARLLSLEGIGSWIDLPSLLSKSSLNESVQYTVKEDGTIAGVARIKATGTDSYDLRRHYHSFDKVEDWIEDTEKDENISISEMVLEDADGYSPTAQIHYDFETDQHFGDDYLYLNVFLTPYHSETAFQKEERYLPVDFPYETSYVYRFAFVIPDEYEIESLPQNEQVVCEVLDGKSLLAILQCRALGNQFSLTYRVFRNATLVPQEQYSELRAYWEHLCQIEKSTLVLKKKK